MPYAHRPEIYDADTHMMERPDWISEFADPGIRPKLPPFVQGKPDTLAVFEDALARFAVRRQDTNAAVAADADFMSMTYKGWHGLGAFDANERAHANDLLGFDGYILFPTPAFDQINAARDRETWLGGVEALNRGLATFSAVDPRMFATAYLPLGAGPVEAGRFLRRIVDADFRIVLIDTIAPNGARSFTHPDYDPVWAQIQAANLSVVLHVGADGGDYQPVPESFYNNGRIVPGRGDGDVPPDALNYMAIQYNAELFLAAMIFDGVLERFPNLRIGVVELGASWTVSWMKRLDQSFRAFRSRQDLSDVKMKPSEYVTRQIWFTPFAGEDIGWLLDNGVGERLMFASDYPHHEGTDDPIGRFERTMTSTSEAAKHRFYTDNFKAFMTLS